MLTLALDTSTPVAGLALARDGKVISEWHLNLPRRSHAEKLLPALDKMLGLLELGVAQLEGLAVAIGPGSFTGLRVGVSTARALAQVMSLPLVGVSTLDLLAAGVSRPGVLICPLLDAKQGYLYTALYRQREHQVWPQRETDILAIRPEGLRNHLGQGTEPVVLVGDGVELAAEAWRPLGSCAVRGHELQHYPRTGFLALQGEELLSSGQGQSWEQVLPLYVRPPAAQMNLARRRVREAEKENGDVRG